MRRPILANLGFLLQIAGSLTIVPIAVGLCFNETLVVFSIMFSTIGVSFTDALFEVGSALTTNAISMGATTVSMPLFYKWLLTTAMIIGRVEIMSILIALSRYGAEET